MTTRCDSCGAALRADVDICNGCGRRSAGSAVSDETVAIAGPSIDEEAATVLQERPSASRPMLVSSTSRYQSEPCADEGRFLPGTLIAGRYRMIELLGKGGMGEVYRATDLTLAQSVALKFLPSAAENTRLIERFHNEVRVARQVSHPNVCRVYDIGEAEGMPFISMEYVDGEDLSSLLQRIGRLPSDKAMDITRRLCAGVAAAHEKGIIHRDLKPQNIMLNRRGEVVIMDFGLAAVAAELSGPEARNGTPAYMSPEQLRGDAVTLKSDIYALGLIIYELFTGRRAFDAKSLAEMIQQQEAHTPVSLTTLVSDADPSVEKVVLRCLHPDPAQRPANALAISAALPGGDPLAAALAAGEMPSPELVAASGKAEGIPAKYAVPCLMFCLAGLMAMPLLHQKIAMTALAPPPYPPSVLVEKAREITLALGHTPKMADHAEWMTVSPQWSRYLAQRPKEKRDWGQLLRAESGVRLFYRQSPELLVAPVDGDIHDDRPGLKVPGMVSVLVTDKGLLRGFDAVAGPEMKVQAPADAAQAVFRAAGLDQAKFREVEPTRVPVLAFDARRAWRGPLTGIEDVELGVELATWKGVPVHLELIWPWEGTQPAGPAPGQVPPPQQRILQIIATIVTTIGITVAIWLAQKNLRKGRGDRRGGLRLASVWQFLSLAAGLLMFHWVPSLDVMEGIFTNTAIIVAQSLLLWLLYVALEPSVRATWPHTLITWNRALAGHVGDAQVASHVLIGATAGMLLRLAVDWRVWWAVHEGGTPQYPGVVMWLGTHRFLSTWLQTLTGALTTSLIIFFLLSGIRAAVKKDWLAALLAAMLLTLMGGGVRSSSNLMMDVPLYVLVYGVFALILLRMGLVPSIAGVLVVNSTGRLYFGPDFLHWFNAPAVANSLMIAAIVIWAYWRSQSTPELQRS